MSHVGRNISLRYVPQRVSVCAADTVNELTSCPNKKIAPSETDYDSIGLLFDALEKQQKDDAHRILKSIENECKKQPKTGKSMLSKLLMFSIEKGNSGTVKQLAETGANLNDRFYGKPFLHLAACRGNTEIAEELLRGRADIHAVDIRGDGIIYNVLTSKLHDKEHMVKWLINQGANIHAKCSSGKSLLHVASVSSAAVVELLVQKGHNINAGDDVNNDTPLHIACGMCCKETILQLIKCGSFLNPMNRHGQTPLAKLLRFTHGLSDFHSETRINIARLLIYIGFRIPYKCSRNVNNNQTHTNKRHDKCYEVYSKLVFSAKEVPSLQNLSRVVIRQSLASGIGVKKQIHGLNIPLHLKSYLLFQDLRL